MDKAFPPTAPDPQVLRWRIPPDGDPRLLRLAIAQTGLATVVCALVLLVAAPREVLGFGLVVLAPIAAGAAFWQWRRYRRSLEGPANTWLDEAGVHWQDAAGNEQTLPRADVTGFRVAIEEDTLRPVPALTLYLSAGQESQPLELHEPATPGEVRRLLHEKWQIEERPTAGPPGAASYDLAIDVYSECHDEFQEWHLEGTAAALAEFFDAVAEAADLPLSPLGVKAARRVILARRREPSRVVIEHDRHTRFGRDSIAGTSEVLAELAMHGRTALTQDLAGRAEADLKRDLFLGRGNVWTFHLHVRPE
jgi:hypothetical protein